jgi:drug/metabolite transporter (DMT)-like permease
MEILNTWQFNLLGFLICVVAYFQFYKLAVRNTKKDGAATLLLQLIAGIFVLFLTPFLEIKFPTEIKWYLLLIVACIFYMLNDRLQTTARKNLPVSTFSILNQLTTVILITYGFVIFKEPLVLTKIIGALVVLFANALLIYKKGKFEFNKYVVISILALFSFATAMSIDIGIAQQFNLPIYIMLTLIIPAFMLFFGERIKISEIVREYNSKERKYYFLTGIFWALTIFFSLRAFQFGKVTTIVPLQATNVLLNVAIAYFFLGEKKDGLKKIIAAILIIIGIYLTVM